MVEELAVAERDVHPQAPVVATRLEQQDADVRIGGEPRGQDAACGACPDDDVVVRAAIFGHDAAS
jgi:hypothetical protein